MRVQGWKVVGWIFVSALLSFFGFFAVIIASLAGGQKFYVPYIIVLTLGLIIFIGLWVFDFFVRRVRIISLIVFLLALVISLATYEVHNFYINSFSVVAEEDNLWLYRPFGEDTKAVSLNEPSTLQLYDQLPRLDGATALYPLYSAFVQATYPNKDYSTYEGEVMCNKTSGAFKNLINGEVDIIFTGHPSKQQIEEAKLRGIELQLTPIGREAFVFFVNSKNGVTNLSTEEIQGIYSGKITNWREVGGANERIRAFQRPQNSGSQTMMQRLMEGKELMTPPKEDVVQAMGGIIQQTANYRNFKNAIGYSFLYYATEMVKNDEIRLLSIDGVEPNRATIKSRQYPLAAEFYAITAGSNNPNVEKLIEWILSPQGQYLVEKTGYTPLR